jgi:hypothetical protein
MGEGLESSSKSDETRVIWCTGPVYGAKYTCHDYGFAVEYHPGCSGYVADREPKGSTVILEQDVT